MSGDDIVEMVEYSRLSQFEYTYLEHAPADTMLEITLKLVECTFGLLMA
jgi:hypothetical protein